jgi:putative membrane protein insertion efficiency factor
MKKIILILINKYQKYISANRPQKCKYYPSCSTYAELAVKEFGLKGVAMSLWRFIRCNPLSHGGVDYPSKHAALVIRERQMS